MEECEILDHAFELISAFDEIVALGYRESVNLAQIRTFTEMDSHEEKVFNAVRRTQEDEAIKAMKKKAQELQMQRKAAQKSGGRSTAGYGGIGSSSFKSSDYSQVVEETLSRQETKKSQSR
ncbi:coatomer subunit delta-like [Anneissia japonica]|uniref:coatomer subunit delta-like n=1 Tax=Anneissia japonica TaxID=1529436 RepID=UPI001425544E|nr:coatomer subunit delta-like [Anneissia japonica]